jgi:hypothetical protein
MVRLMSARAPTTFSSRGANPHFGDALSEARGPPINEIDVKGRPRDPHRPDAPASSRALIVPHAWQQR